MKGDTIVWLLGIKMEIIFHSLPKFERKERRKNYEVY